MNKHISANDLEQYMLGDLSAVELAAFDAHLGNCDECRRMAMSHEDLVVSAETLDRKLSASWPAHLTYADIEGLVDNTLFGSALEQAEEHLSACLVCRDEVDHLREFAKPAPTYIPEAAQQGPNSFEYLKSVLSSRRWALVPVFGVVAVIAATAWFMVPRQPFTDQSQVSNISEIDVVKIPEDVTEEPVVPETKPDVTPPTKLTLALKDGGSTIGISEDGELVGYDNLSNKHAELLRSALLRGTVAVGEDAKEVTPGSGKRMGESPVSAEETIRPIGPLGRVVDTARPTLSWRVLEGVESYRIEVYDLNYNKVASSDDLRQNQWTTELPRGKTYIWRITGSKDGKEVRSSSTPEARFRTLDAARSRDIAAIRKRYPNSHLLLGLAYTEAGMIDEARKEIEALMRANPNSTIAKKLLANLKSIKF